MKSILVPLDGSAFAERALPLAAELARATDARLRLVSVHGLGSSEELLRIVVDSRFLTSLASVEEEYLHRQAATIREQSGVDVDIHLLTGSNVRVLSGFVRREAVDMIVMSTHGRRGMARAWLGSVADAVIRQVAVPVLLVRPQVTIPPRPETAHVGQVLVALDGSRTAEAALKAAEEICGALGADCVLLRVVTPPVHPISPSIEHTARYLHDYIEAGRSEAERYLEAVGEGSAAVVRRMVRVDHQPARAILDAADEIGADLIAVGTRGAGAINRMIVGSVADKVTQGSSVPVLICHGAGAVVSPLHLEAGVSDR